MNIDIFGVSKPLPSSLTCLVLPFCLICRNAGGSRLSPARRKQLCSIDCSVPSSRKHHNYREPTILCSGMLHGTRDIARTLVRSIGPLALCDGGEGVCATFCDWYRFVVHCFFRWLQRSHCTWSTGQERLNSATSTPYQICWPVVRPDGSEARQDQR